MNYKIFNISRNSGWTWIWISHDYYYEPDGMFLLIECIQDEIGGKVVRIVPDDMVFSITTDKYKLRFQWDSCFGTVVLLKNIKDLDEVLALLNRHFEKLNAKKE